MNDDDDDNSSSSDHGNHNNNESSDRSNHRAHNNNNNDDSDNSDLARMKKLFVQGHKIRDSLDPWTKKSVTLAEQLKQIFDEERAECSTATQLVQQPEKEFYVVGKESCKLHAFAVKIRDKYEDWCKQSHQTKLSFSEDCKKFDPEISQWAYGDECPSSAQSSNNNDNDDYDSFCDENKQDDIIQRRKARVKELFETADKTSTSLCDLADEAVSIANQMKGLLLKRGSISRLYRVVEQLYTIADEIEDLCVESDQLLELAKYCFALRCNENVGKDDFTIKCFGCGAYIGQALRQNTTLAYIHLKVELLLENNDDDIQTMNPLIDFVQTSTSLRDVSLDGVETKTRDFSGRVIVVDNYEANLTGHVHKLTGLLFNAVGKNKNIESLGYHGIVPTSAFDSLMSTTQSLKSLELECFDPEDDALGMDALICSAFASNHTIQHLKFVPPKIGDQGLAKNILLELHNCLPKLRRLALTCHERIYDALEPFLHGTTIEHLDLLEFRFTLGNVNYLINGLKQHYFGTSKPTITNLTLKGCDFDRLAKNKLLEFQLTQVEMDGCQVMLLPRLMYTAKGTVHYQSKHLLVALMKAQDSIGPYRTPHKRKLGPMDN